MQPTHRPKEELQAELQDLLVGLGSLVTTYKNLGLRYHSTRLATRERLHLPISHEQRTLARQVFERPAELDREFLVTVEAHTYIANQSSAAIRRGDLRQAEEASKMLDPLWHIFAHDIGKHIEVVTLCLESWEQTANMPSEPDAAEVEEMNKLRRAWILRLPEARKAIELGDTEEEAIAMVLAEEDRIVDDSDELDMTEEELDDTAQ